MVSVDNLTIQGNTYDMNEIERIVKALTKAERIVFNLDMYKCFRNDIYTTYKQIRHICNPRACEKTTLETVKKSLREHWLEHYLNMSLTEAHIVIEYAELFFGLAIK